MNKLTLSFFLILLRHITYGQDSVVIDTFRVNNISFHVNSIAGWSQFSIHDSVQFTSGWNYKTELPQTNVATQPNSFIGVQITNKRPSRSEKEEKNFAKQCTVCKKNVSGWDATYEDYKPRKLSSCRACPPLTEKVYTFALNRKQELTITLHAYLNEPELTAAVNSFEAFSRKFVLDNNNAMIDFGPINYSLEMNSDTFRVQNYFLRSLVPMNYKISKSETNGVYGYEITDSISEFTIEVTAVQLDAKSRPGIIADTVVREIRDYKGTTHSGGYKTAKFSSARLQTKRIIELSDGGCIIVTFSAEKGYCDVASSTHSLTRYADLFVTSNYRPREFLKTLEFPKPGLSTPNKDSNKPNKFEIPLPK